MEGSIRFTKILARIFSGVSCTCALAGIVCNCIIFLATVKTRSLRATYNILIALCALADVLHQFGTLGQLQFLFNVHMEIDSDLCNVIMFLPEIGLAIGCTCILCVGLDRMLSVLFAMKYRAINKRLYHLFMGFLIVSYCGYLSALMIIFRRKRKVRCEIITPYPDLGILWFAGGNFIVNVVSTVAYFVIWMGLRSHADLNGMKRIIKSLFIIFVVDVSGWILTPGLVELSQHIGLNTDQKLAMERFSVIFINVALSVKLPIYYFTSTEYREAIRSIVFGKSSSSKISMTVEIIYNDAKRNAVLLQ